MVRLSSRIFHLNQPRASDPHSYNLAKLTGITNEMVETAPKFYEVAKKIIELTDDSMESGGKSIVAHNVFFDYQFLQREFSELGYSFRRKLFCTVKNARRAFPGLASYSLKNLTTHFNIDLKKYVITIGLYQIQEQLMNYL